LTLAFALVALVLGVFGLVALQALTVSLGRLDVMIQVATTANQIGVVVGNSSAGPIKDLLLLSTGDQAREAKVVQAGH
jgi:hypothetical protein